MIECRQWKSTNLDLNVVLHKIMESNGKSHSYESLRGDCNPEGQSRSMLDFGEGGSWLKETEYGQCNRRGEGVG